MIQILERDEGHLLLQLKDMKNFDPGVFTQMEMDETCIRCVLMNQALGIISYQTQGLISLNDMLSQYQFKKEEGLTFLCDLFRSIIAVNRNKPILLHPDYVFATKYGDSFRFISLPIHLENPYSDNEQNIAFLQNVLKIYQAQSHFEIPGYICCFMKSAEFSLPNLILGLENLVQVKKEKKFFFRKRRVHSFRVSEPFQPLYKPESVEPVKETVFDDNKTHLIGQPQTQFSYLLIQGENVPLRTENVLVGRSMACDIRLENESISLKHAKLICQDNKWYIQDLKSTNGTYLNHKKVQRKMRLRDNMLVQFGQVECEFHS